MRLAQHIETHIHAGDAADTVTLDYEARFLRRKRLVSDGGEAFLVELAETRSLNQGEGFRLDDGRVIAVKAAPEPLMAVRHDNLPRIAWHGGNRHTPCQIADDHILDSRGQGSSGDAGRARGNRHTGHCAVYAGRRGLRPWPHAWS